MDDRQIPEPQNPGPLVVVMRAAVLSPGPSLSLYPGRSGYDLVVTVNRSAIAHPSDAWAASDWPVIFAGGKEVAIGRAAGEVDSPLGRKLRRSILVLRFIT